MVLDLTLSYDLAEWISMTSVICRAVLSERVNGIAPGLNRAR